MKQKVKAYIAGIVDGEGCIGVYWNSDHWYVVVTVANTDYRLLGYLKYCYNGCISKEHQYGKSKPFKQWRVVANDAKLLLKDIEPHLLIKRYRAQLALKFLSYAQGKRIKQGKRFRALFSILNA